MTRVTGTANCCPSGPKVTGIPTNVAFAATGALGLKVMEIETLAVRALAGTVTVTPSRLTLPPAGPMVALADPASDPPEPELQAVKRAAAQTEQQKPMLFMFTLSQVPRAGQLTRPRRPGH